MPSQCCVLYLCVYSQTPDAKGCLPTARGAVRSELLLQLLGTQYSCSWFFFILFLFIRGACVSKGLSCPCGVMLESTISRNKLFPAEFPWPFLGVAY